MYGIHIQVYTIHIHVQLRAQQTCVYTQKRIYVHSVGGVGHCVHTWVHVQQAQQTCVYTQKTHLRFLCVTQC